MRKYTLAMLWMMATLALTGPAQADERVRVMYAGSLVHVMEQQLGPAFTRATDIAFEGYAGGSNALAQQIKGRLRQADVFISASPNVNALLIGAHQGDWVGWYVQFAQSPLLIGYNPASRFAAGLQHQRWDRALTQPGIRIGRTDPQLDPKGAFVMQLLQQAQTVYADPTLSQRMLGDAENPAQVLPEEALVGRLQTGQLDAGFFYSTETTVLHLPSIALPAPFDIQARYTITVIKRAPDAAAAERFVAFVLSPAGQAILRDAGLQVNPPVLAGDPGQLPATLRPSLTPAHSSGP